MKTCSNCNAQIEDTSRFCRYCGAKCEDYNGTEEPVYSPVESPAEAPDNSYSMKWHKFLMVVMIIGAIFTAIDGISKITGTEYASHGLDAERVYSTYPGLKNCDTVYGIVLIALGVFQFVVRNRLNQFRANGPFSLKIMYGISIVAGVIYIIWASAVTGVNLFDSSNMGSIGGSIVLLIINSVYYSKRSELFVN